MRDRRYIDWHLKPRPLSLHGTGLARLRLEEAGPEQSRQAHREHVLLNKSDKIIKKAGDVIPPDQAKRVSPGAVAIAIATRFRTELW